MDENGQGPRAGKPEVQAHNIINYLNYTIILMFFLATLIRVVSDNPGPATLIGFTLLVLFALLHGIPRYGVSAMLIWFLIAWVVSNAFETLSIATGFPFGHYHYALPGPRLFNVPPQIMPTYFGISYLSWTVAQAVTGHFGRPITGMFKLIIPLAAAMVMTMWDLVTDPQASTIHGNWTWHEGGSYFGVPITNFAGWVLVVYIIMQLFTLLIASRDQSANGGPVTHARSFWLQAVAIYLIMGTGVVLDGALRETHREIYASMGMVAIFTMIFIAAIALLNIQRGGSDFSERPMT